MERITIENLHKANLLQELTWKDVAFHIVCSRRKAQTTIKKVRTHFNTTQLRINLYQLLVFQGIPLPIEIKNNLVN
jgi:hypothetical protein